MLAFFVKGIYVWFMKKTWMNIRGPLIKQAGIKDRSYEEDILKLEEKDKLLSEDFNIPGYSLFNKYL